MTDEPANDDPATSKEPHARPSDHVLERLIALALVACVLFGGALLARDHQTASPLAAPPSAPPPQPAPSDPAPSAPQPAPAPPPAPPPSNGGDGGGDPPSQDGGGLLQLPSL